MPETIDGPVSPRIENYVTLLISFLRLRSGMRSKCTGAPAARIGKDRSAIQKFQDILRKSPKSMSRIVVPYVLIIVSLATCSSRSSLEPAKD